MKRKADDTPPQTEAKRAKGNDGTPRPCRAQSFIAPTRTISFDEVYQHGEAKFKHTIVEYPKNNGRYYILKCEEHGVHFNANPLHGAAKHLASAQHGNMSKERTQAVQVLGYEVVGCTPEKVKLNNSAVQEALTNGYKPLNMNHMRKSDRRSLVVDATSAAARPEQGGSANHQGKAHGEGSATHQGEVHGLQQGEAAGPSTQPQNRPASSALSAVSQTSADQPQAPALITRPTPGQLYLGFWADENEKRNYAVMLLPWTSDLSDAGLSGTLGSIGLLKNHPPRCFKFDKRKTRVLGWAPGFEDGGKYEAQRKFPVMYFDRPTDR